MTYLVTGAAGFIASKVCEQLLNDGKQIVGIDNLNDANDPTLKEYRLKKLKTFSNFTFQKIDIANKEELTTLFENNQFEAIINLAARAGVRISNRQYFTEAIRDINGRTWICSFVIF